MWTLIFVMCMSGTGANKWLAPNCVAIVTDFQTKELCDKAWEQLETPGKVMASKTMITCVQKSSSF